MRLPGSGALPSHWLTVAGGGSSIPHALSTLSQGTSATSNVGNAFRSASFER
jgi:hypothetical protein